MSKTYSITEIFLSFQGEGFHAGAPAIFVRFAGCNKAGGKCLFCDTDYSEREQLTADEIIQRMLVLHHENGGLREGAYNRRRMIVLTGGEPLLQVDDEFIDAVKAQWKYFAPIHLETNGTVKPMFDLDKLDWITFSPKPGTLEIIDQSFYEAIRHEKGFYSRSHANLVNELKVVYPGCDEKEITEDARGGWSEWTLNELETIIVADHHFLQPQDCIDDHNSKLAMKETVEMITQGPMKTEWRLSIQMHKVAGSK